MTYGTGAQSRRAMGAAKTDRTTLITSPDLISRLAEPA